MKTNKLTLVKFHANDIAFSAYGAHWYLSANGHECKVLLESVKDSFEKLAAALGYSITPIPDEPIAETPVDKDETQ